MMLKHCVSDEETTPSPRWEEQAFGYFSSLEKKAKKKKNVDIESCNLSFSTISCFISIESRWNTIWNKQTKKAVTFCVERKNESDFVGVKIEYRLALENE